MSGFGVETKLIYRGDQILRGFDNEIRDHVANEMSKNGISISLNADIQRINLTSNGLEITETSGRKQNFDQVLAATGRMPNSDDLGLEKSGIEIGKKGEILVDEYDKTKVSRIT